MSENAFETFVFPQSDFRLLKMSGECRACGELIEIAYPKPMASVMLGDLTAAMEAHLLSCRGQG